MMKSQTILVKLTMCSVVIMTGLHFLSLRTRRLQIWSVQPKLSGFYVDYIVATSIIPYMEISHDLVTK